MCALSLLTALLCAAFIAAVIYREGYADLQTQVRAEARLVALGLDGGQTDSFGAASRVSPDTRLTLISPDGTVLFDSEASAGQMENHAHRSEVAAALSSGAGEATRVSGTLGKRTFYYALRLNDGRVLRVSAQSESALSALAGVLPWMLLAAAVSSVLAMLLARALTAAVIRPINGIDLDAPLQNEAYDELAPLMLRLERQRVQIEQQMRALTRKQQEFSAIADHMREGLVVLDSTQNILTINRSAASLFCIDEKRATGRHILTVDRSETLRRAVERAAKGEAGEAQLSLSGREYQILANPVPSDGGISGVVLLMLDITEHRRAEQMRREFSANVSHELKTPLTAISGYAEMLKDNMVRAEDTAEFAKRIYEESRRLIVLIEDIMQLSRLDEHGGEIRFEPVGLLAAAKQAAGRLESGARENGVLLTVQGEEATVSAAPKLLDELIFNLCDNAVKYNRPGGSVTVSVIRRGETAVLSVADTGIGISREHQSRVFERFYRVDKSHSKETGGTGLGLSIVKHIARLHGAAIDLQSRPEAGTTVTVSFATQNT